MVYQMFYVIKPSEALRRQLSADDSDIAGVLLEPTVWTKNHSDRSSWSAEDHLAQVKLLFLAYLKQEYAAYPECRQLVGDPPIRLEIFDQWWTVETYLADEKAEEVEKTLDRRILQGMAKTGFPAVDNWISSFQGGIGNGKRLPLPPTSGHPTSEVSPV